MKLTKEIRPALEAYMVAWSYSSSILQLLEDVAIDSKAPSIFYDLPDEVRTVLPVVNDAEVRQLAGYCGCEKRRSESYPKLLFGGCATKLWDEIKSRGPRAPVVE